MDDFFYNPEPEAPEEVPSEPEPEASEEVPSEPEPEAPEEVPSEPEPSEPETPEEVPSEPEPEAPEEVPSEPEPSEPETPEEEPGEPEAPEEPVLEEPPAEPETPPAEETGDGEMMKDLIDVIGDLNETITGAVTQEPEELPAGGEGGVAGGDFGGSQTTESASVDLSPVVQVLERNEKLLTQTIELLEQQGEVLVTQHNDLLQLQANVDFVFLAVAALIGVVLGGLLGLVLDRIWRI